jgi:hypothetical protein
MHIGIRVQCATGLNELRAKRKPRIPNDVRANLSKIGRCYECRFIRLLTWLDAAMIAVAINLLRWFATYGDTFDHSVLDRDINHEEDDVREERC